VAVLLEVSAFLYLVLRPQNFTGSLGTWFFCLAGLGVLPVATVVTSLISSRDWPLRILLMKGLIVFWATLPETAFLPVRWMLFCALVTGACTFLSGWSKGLVSAAFLAELLLVQNVLSGMTAVPPDAGTTVLVLGLISIPGILVHVAQSASARLEFLEDRNDKLHASVLQLTSANTEFLEQANMATEESAVLERHRITRELHDVVGQTLTNIIMMMDAALHRKADDPEETVKLLRWIRKQAQTGLEETRAVLYELRALKPTALRGLKALKKLVETFSRLSRIKTKVEWGNLPWTFDPAQETAVYYLVQGSLSNAFRHGLATRIDLHFQVDREVLHIMVRDNGRGGPDGSLGLGQRGMEERLAPWHGTVTFRSEPYGYTVIAALPLVDVKPKEGQHGTRQDPDR
jgi:signal transduction histidine kinase